MNIKSCFTPTRRYKVLISAVHSIYRLVNSTFELKDLIPRLARLICQIFNSRYCLIIILDPSRKYSTIKCMVSGRKRIVIDKNKKITNRIEKKIIRTFTAIKKDYLLGIPLVSEDIMGLILLKRAKTEAPFDKADQEIMMTMAEQAMIGIKNLQLYEEQQKIFLGSIKSLVTLLDARIPQEYTHSPHFSRLVVALAHQMRLDEKQVESLKYASLLHDAGKIDVPLEILTKTTKLTANEYKIIRRHPVMGAQMLRPFQMLKPAIPIIMHHHEKYNGTGYPSRLKKGQIPLGARVMAVADAFEAMVYGRPYRERVNVDIAIREIKKKSGTQFDPKVVEAFLRIAKSHYKKYLQQV
ncbi:MAG: HD domain-containing protein [Candidatus Omnitrophica bacterium]|jgi:putative nucleotidyltransferase with HDIG domain|nr:HD domain-containing protein [Candidatus Omnitrophota bacterium]MDD5078976.1 HD domain-containing protein [Candidatus Omnitrophota bacterium]